LPDYPEVNIILDGFTISSGNANGSWPNNCGGGLYLYNPCCRGPTISNCKFSSNSGVWAGGIWGCGGPIVNCLITANAASTGGGLSNCSGPIKNSTISNNFARDAGGGVSTYLDDHFENCTIIDNVAGVYGGGIYTENCSPILYNCTVRGNSAVLGGGMHNRAYDDYSNPVLIGCQFISNLAKGDGGGINNDYPSYYGFLTMTNCIFSRNLAAGIGGGIGNYAETNLILTNCTFAANLATNGNALSCKSQYPEYPYPSDLRLTNCILWDGGNEIFNGDGSKIDITYSDIKDGWLGEGNINTDPCFANLYCADYHLKSQAGRWDANEGRWTKDDVTSLCIDAGDPSSPIGLEPFPNGGIINMGAYGGTAEASKSYFGEPVCETVIAGDINGDCKVNFFDLALMVLHWLDNYSP
ncbi:MAG: hypothetical protein NTX52_15555, partial [Planctomycetota bacterium]|nr:hypothetical protein [Planctomycetota bacterium]